MRNCQVNFGIVTGLYDPNYNGYIHSDDAKENWYTGGADVELETWYVLDDETSTSETLGKIYETSVTDNVQLQEAIDNRSTRIVSFNAETHSKNFFSTQTTADVVKYFEQTLGYNCGELSDPTTTPLDVNNSVFMWREYLNTFAMLSMVMMCIALAGTLLGTKFFAPCVATPYRGSLGVFNKTKYSRQKERHDLRRVVLFGFRPPEAASTLCFYMLGQKHPQGARHIRRAAKLPTAVQEIRLVPRFSPAVKTLVRRKRAAGQKAGWVIFKIAD